MSTLLINADQPEEIRVALVEKKNTFKILNLYIEDLNKKRLLKNIYAGTVSNVRIGLNALFIKYEAEVDRSENRIEQRHGFLPFSEIAPAYYKEGDHKNMENFLDRKIIVQIKNEKRGDKGPVLTTYITLSGSYLVLAPNKPRASGISKRIGHEDRKSMREIINQLQVPKSMGIILRTASLDKPLKALQNDLNLLVDNWNAIEKAFQSQKAPFLIFQEGDILARAIRDYLREDIEKIIVDDPTTFEKVKYYTRKIRPDLLEKLYLHHNKKPLFLSFEVEDEVESAFQTMLRLPSGGTIVINRCEALTAIDINSGRSTRHKNITETALKTNLEAAEAIARQLRLRDIGGLIVVDFIDMEDEEHKRQVEKKLLENTAEDRARIQMSQISSFGLLEMSRQRLRASLGSTNEEVCTCCQGDGTKRSTQSLALAVIRTIEKRLFQKKASHIQIKASMELMTYLSNEKRNIIHQIEKDHDCTLILTSTFEQKSNYYEILNFGPDEFNPQLPSYLLQSNSPTVSKPYSPFEIPAVRGFGEDSTLETARKESFFKDVAQSLNRAFQRIRSVFTSKSSATPIATTAHNRFKKAMPAQQRRFEKTHTTAAAPASSMSIRKSNNIVLSNRSTDTTVKTKNIETAAVLETSKQSQDDQTLPLKQISHKQPALHETKSKTLSEIQGTSVNSDNNQSLSKTPIKKAIVHRYGGEIQVKQRNYSS